MSRFPLEEVCQGNLGSNGNNQFVTVRVQGFYLTSLHLIAKKKEVNRLHQLANLREKLSEKGVWDKGKMHVLAGDFNSLTFADKSEAEWAEVAVERNEANFEEPKFQVTASMGQKNFSDCWAKVGTGGLRTTCQ